MVDSLMTMMSWTMNPALLPEKEKHPMSQNHQIPEEFSTGWLPSVNRKSNGLCYDYIGTWDIPPMRNSPGSSRARTRPLSLWRQPGFMNAQFATSTNVQAVYRYHPCRRRLPSMSEYRLTLCGWCLLATSEPSQSLWCQTPWRGWFQLAYWQQRIQRNSSRVSRKDGSGRLAPWRSSKWMSTVLGRQRRWGVGARRTALNCRFHQDRATQGWLFWNVVIRWPGRLSPSSWWTTQILECLPVNMWCELSTTWYRKSIDIPMFEAILQCNGLWDTHLTSLDCWWRKRLATTQPNWILPNNLWKNCDFSNQHSRLCLRQI